MHLLCAKDEPFYSREAGGRFRNTEQNECILYKFPIIIEQIGNPSSPGCGVPQRVNIIGRDVMALRQAA